MTERERRLGHRAHVFISLVKVFESSAEAELADDKGYQLWADTYGSMGALEASRGYSAAALVAWKLAQALAEERQTSVIEVLDELDQRLFRATNDPDVD